MNFSPIILQNLCVQQIALIRTYRLEKDSYPLINRGRYRSGLIYTLKGQEEYVYNNGEITTYPDTVLFLPQGLQYSITMSDPVSDVIAMDFSTFGGIPDAPILFELKEGSPILYHFQSAEKLWNSHDSAGELGCRSLFYRITADICRHYETIASGGRSPQIEDALKDLYENCLNPTFRVESLSKKAGLSQRYFNKLFEEHYHCSPKEYIIDYRMKKATDLLRNEKMSLSDVADFLGYCDAYYFSKQFKAHFGCTPTEYRKSFSQTDS